MIQLIKSSFEDVALYSPLFIFILSDLFMVYHFSIYIYIYIYTFKCEKDTDLFLAQLNSMHPSLKFTVEREFNPRLPFLDVFVHKTPTAFLTSVYRKPTFFGLYTR